MLPIGDIWRETFSIDRPGKIVCVGLNYRDHVAEGEQALPDEPLLFGKFANTLIGSGEPIILPASSTHVDAEAELALVVGHSAKNVNGNDALNYIFGYTVANDVSARDLQFQDGQWFRGKGFDTFCPLLSQITPASELDPTDLRVVQRLNGEVIQNARTSSLIFDLPTVVSHISTVMTLEPGDLILTGTPSGVGYFRTPKIGLRPGDVVEIEVEGVGKLSNPVMSERERPR